MAFEVDWSQAPSDADAWEMTEFGIAIWTKQELIDVTSFDSDGIKTVEGTGVAGREPAPDFGYAGKWQDSRQARP